MPAVLLAQSSDEAVGILAFLFMIICVGGIVILSVLQFVFWIWMIIDCVQNEANHPDNQLVVWILVLVFGSGLGALIYFFVRKVNRRPLPSREGYQHQHQHQYQYRPKHPY